MSERGRSYQWKLNWGPWRVRGQGYLYRGELFLARAITAVYSIQYTPPSSDPDTQHALTLYSVVQDDAPVVLNSFLISHIIVYLRTSSGRTNNLLWVLGGKNPFWGTPNSKQCFLENVCISVCLHVRSESILQNLHQTWRIFCQHMGAGNYFEFVRKSPLILVTNNKLYQK